VEVKRRKKERGKNREGKWKSFYLVIVVVIVQIFRPEERVGKLLKKSLKETEFVLIVPVKDAYEYHAVYPQTFGTL